jgi:uncharacterized Zn-binding protein involved in type VI secretion
MPGVGRVGVDSAGGIITGALVPNVRVNGSPIVVVGATVAPHGNGPHSNATMAVGSSKVKAHGIPVCRAGDAATCSDTLSPGSSTVFAN